MSDQLSGIERIQSFLVSSQIITDDQWNNALAISKTTGERIEKVLQNKGYISQQESIEILELIYDAPYINLSEQMFYIEALSFIPEEVARTNKLIPVSINNNQIIIAMANPHDLIALDHMRFLSSLTPQIFFSFEEDINKAIDFYYGKMKLIPSDEILSFDITGQKNELIDFRNELVKDEFTQSLVFPKIHDKPALETVDDIFRMAIKYNVSDVHLEPILDGLILRFRISGKLYDVQVIPSHIAKNVPLRIKVMSSINIEPDLFLSNECDIKIDNKILRTRISILRTVDGEKINCRILNQRYLFNDFWHMITDERVYNPLYKMLSRNRGLTLIATPPDIKRHKDATLFALLNHILMINPHRSIIAIGKSMDFQLIGIYYIPVSESFSYKEALHAAKQQDPDIIIIDSLEDIDTIEAAFRLALEGHIVMATLETYLHSASVICELIKRGISPFWIAFGLNGIITERWTKKICSFCRTEYVLPGDDWRWEFLQLKPEDKIKARFFYGKGCSVCNETGYSGQLGIYEILHITERLKCEIVKSSDINIINDYVYKEGTVALKNNAMKYLFYGLVSLDDIVSAMT